MKCLSFIILSFLFLHSCAEEAPTQIVSHNLLESLQEAEALRFSHPIIVDTILHNIYENLSESNSNELWAKYYFLQAHIQMGKDKFVEAAYYMDSAIQSDLDFKEVYNEKIMLFNGILNQHLYNYDEAKVFYSSLYQSLSCCSLTAAELLRLYFGYAKIHFLLRENHHEILAKALELEEYLQPKDRGYYYANIAWFNNDTDTSISLYKKAYQSYLANNEYATAYCMLYNIGGIFVKENQDSAAHYLEKSRILCEEKVNEHCCFYDKKMGLYYVTNYVEYLQSIEEYPNAIDELKVAIPKAKEIKDENLLFVFYKDLANCYYHTKQYAEAMRSKDLALKHRLEYSTQILSSRIKYNNAREHVGEIKRENLYLKKSQHLKDRLFLAYSIIISLLAYILFINRKEIKGMLRSAKEQVREKEETLTRAKDDLRKKNIHLLQKQDQVKNVFQVLEHPSFKDKSKLYKIEEIVEESKMFSSWEVLNEFYQDKYPEGEKHIRKLCPGLSDKEYQYMQCCHYGLSHEKMADVFSIKKESVRKRSQRIKKTLHLTPDADLKKHILQKIQE